MTTYSHIANNPHRQKKQSESMSKMVMMKKRESTLQGESMSESENESESTHESESISKMMMKKKRESMSGRVKV